MNWLQIVLQFLPGIIKAIADAVGGEKPSNLTVDEHLENKAHLVAAQAHFNAAHEHLQSVKI